MITATIIALVMQAAPAPAKPAQPPSPPPAPPSLDEALGMGDGAAADAPGSDIDAALSGAPPKDILESALADMRRSKALLDARESGLPARRAQESVVRKLDELIATAQRMQQEQDQQRQQQQQQGRQGQGSPRPGSGRPDRSQGAQPEGEQPGQGEPRPAQGGRRARANDGDGRREGDAGEADSTVPPTTVDPSDASAQFDESRVEWGQLPPRVREAVRQGVKDPMSAAYRRLTQEYYRRLAEGAKR
jgi:hypothetical protein